MVSTMTTRNAGRRTAATRGGGTSEHDGREGGQGSQGGGRDGQESDQGSQGSSRGNRANGGGGGVPDFATLIAQQNQDDNVINDNNQGNVRNMKNGRGSCSYKEFMACNPKDYDRMGGVIVYTRWIEKMESVQDMSGCGENQKVKYTASSFIGKALTWWNSQISAMVAATEPTTIQSVVLKARMLTDKVIRNGALKKVTEKRGNNREPSRDGNARNDNKRSRTGRAFATVTNPVRKEYTGPRIVNPLNARNPTAARGACFECDGTDHYKAAYPRLTKSALFLPIHEDFMMDSSRIRLKWTALDRQYKLLMTNSRKPLEFNVGDHVLLKVLPWKGVVRFGKKGKLAPRFVGPFEITKRIGLMAYRLRLPQELNGVHDMFHVSNFKKFLADPTLHVPLEEIQVDAKLNYVEEPIEILEREF
ncbi:hypothetical protein Tco_1447031 [Tanacetum coccineum]